MASCYHCGELATSRYWVGATPIDCCKDCLYHAPNTTRTSEYDAGFAAAARGEPGPANAHWAFQQGYKERR